MTSWAPNIACNVDHCWVPKHFNSQIQGGIGFAPWWDKLMSKWSGWFAPKIWRISLSKYESGSRPPPPNCLKTNEPKLFYYHSKYFPYHTPSFHQQKKRIIFLWSLWGEFHPTPDAPYLLWIHMEGGAKKQSCQQVLRLPSPQRSGAPGYKKDSLFVVGDDGFFWVECRLPCLEGRNMLEKQKTTDFIQMLLIKIRVKMIDCLPLSEGNVNFCTIILGHRHIGSNLSSPFSSNHHGNHEEIQFPRAKSPLPKPFKDGHHYVDDYWRRSQEVHMEVSSEPRHIKPMVLSTYSSKSIHIPICIWKYFFSLYMSKGVVCSGTGLYHFLSFFRSFFLLDF